MILFLIPYFLCVYLKILNGLHMLQQNFYNEQNRYLNWIRKNLKKTIFNIDLFTLLTPFILLLNNNLYIYVLLFCLYFIIFIIKYNNKKKEQVKKALVITFRIKRLLFTCFIFYLLLFIFVKDLKILLFILSIMLVLAHFLVYLAYLINLPIEKIVYNHYKNKASTKLKELNTINIGITGSYGKTSSKNILHDILSVKYRTFSSPGNLNTPLGLMRTINNYLDKFEEIFIAEISISAPKTKDVEKSCSFIKPKYGIITNIGIAHLETFKTQEAIQKAKFKLIESLPENGLGILNKDDVNQVNYNLKNNCKIKWIGIDNEADVTASNIKYTHEGTSFDCTFKDDNKTISLKTCLFGKPNIYNILAALALSKELGLTYDEMVRGVASVKPIEHRLEIKKFPYYTIIDDAYNSNPVGSKMAIDVLNLMPGKKIVVTPGMIELKDKQYELNFEFGKQIANVADYVILVGKNQTKPIYDGLISNKFNEKNIFITNDVKEAFPKINEIRDKNTYVLLENDLPDLFNEKK